MKCFKCGADLSDNSKFCSFCGAKIESKVSDSSQTADDSIANGVLTEAPDEESYQSASAQQNTSGGKRKSKLQSFWSGLDLFCKVSVVSIVIIAILLIIAISTGKALPIFLSALQFSGVIVALLMHKEKIKLAQKKKWTKYLVLVLAILFTALNIMSYSLGRDSKPANSPAYNPTDSQTPIATDTPVVITTASAPYGASDCIGKPYAGINGDFSSAGFVSVEVEKVEDLQSTEADRVDTIESISIGGKTDFAAGQEFDKYDDVVIRYHAFEPYHVTIHVDFISNWILSTYDVNLLVNGEDKGTLTHGDDEDFSFDIEPGEYTLTFENAESSSVKGEVSLVVDCDIEASYKISCYSDKVSVEELYVDRLTELADGDVKLDVSESDYNYKNYEEVTTALKTLGFTNIKYEVLYDIVLGWTENGEVDNVSIAGNKDFKRGDVFAADAEIIITYHMPEADDPTKIHPPKSASEFLHQNYEDAEKILKEAGFTNITLKFNMGLPGEGEEGEVESIYINEQSSFSTSTSFEPDAEVVIIYTKLKEILTVDNNSDFAALMKIADQTDAATIKQFVNAHIGEVIEFDGCIALMMNHNNYKTRFDVLIAGGNYDADKVYGPLFAFEDVSYYDMNVSGSDTVAEGMNFKIVAEIKGFSDEGGYVLLEPVSLTER